MDESLAYLYKIKRAFPDNPAVYLLFEKIVRAFLDNKMDAFTIADKVTELFRGHQDLLVGFTRYLPTVCRSGQSTDALQNLQRLRYETALYFVNAVELAYLGQPHIFAEFSNINLDDQLHPLVKLKKIRKLFIDRPEFIQTFQGFMPSGFSIDDDVYEADSSPSDIQNKQGN